MSTKKSTKGSKKGWRSFVAGSCAGACEIVATMPLDVVKTRMQIYGPIYSNPISGMATIYRDSGFKALYYGMPAFLMQTSMKAAIRFTAFEYLKEGMAATFGEEAVARNQNLTNLTAGVIAGTVEATAWTTPTERLKVLRQNEVGAKNPKYTSIVQTVQVITKEQGVRGIWTGGVPTAIRQGSSVGVRFMLYGQVKGLLCKPLGQDPNNASDIVNLLSGGTVGALSVIINNPVDVIKSSVQSSDTKAGIVETGKKIFQTSGVSGFTRGLSARVPRVFMGQAITFSVYERILGLLGA